MGRQRYCAFHYGKPAAAPCPLQIMLNISCQRRADEHQRTECRFFCFPLNGKQRFISRQIKVSFGVVFAYAHALTLLRYFF
jgi:hypothetical protein